MITEVELISICNEIADPRLAEPWDNCGFQVRGERKHYARALIALEITKGVIAEAIELETDIIITHHPLLFSAINKIDNNTVIGNYVYQLIKNDIAVFSLHTNFDKAQEGNNIYMAKLLGLEQIKFLRIGDGEYDYMGCTGSFTEEITLAMAVNQVCMALSLQPSEIKVVGNGDLPVKEIALCTGAGADFIDLVASRGCQLYITGDINYHEAQKAKELGLAVIDAGHYGTEAIFVNNFNMQLKAKTKNLLQVFASTLNLNPFDAKNMRIDLT